MNLAMDVAILDRNMLLPTQSVAGSLQPTSVATERLRHTELQPGKELAELSHTRYILAMYKCCSLLCVVGCNYISKDGGYESNH
jgi:hypothetical protein